MLLYHHLGLGDHILLSGGLKYLKRKKKLGPVLCLCKHANLVSVTQLFSDVQDFEIVAVKGGEEADLLTRGWSGTSLRIGFERMKDWYRFDVDFYRILEVDFDERWSSFSIARNPDAENKLLAELNLPDKFVFIHDDPSRGYLIDPIYIDKSLPVIKPHLTNSIFDWLPVLERASEIHCICSSFKHLIDSIDGTTSNLFYHHSYVDGGKPREMSISASKKNWRYI